MMTYEASEAAAFRYRLLTSPGERQGVEYKASMAFTGTDSFSLKLIRNIQGMANADGGWFVIGYREHPNGQLGPDPNHGDVVCNSYEPTNLAKQVNSTIQRGQQIRLSVYFELHPSTGLRYPIISVEGFERTPYVCRSSQKASDTSEDILRQGAVYLRRPTSEASEVSTSQDWEELISLAVKKRRDEFLAEFGDLFERMSSPKSPSVSAIEQFESWAAGMRRRALAKSD